MTHYISNCQTTILNQPVITGQAQQQHLYLLEVLSPVTIQQDQRQFSLAPFDIILTQAFNDLRFQSLDGSPLLLRWTSLLFDLPTPLTQCTVGDNPIIHDLMNEDQQGRSQLIFTQLSARVCHAYLDAIEQLDKLDQADDYVYFQRQKVAGLLFTELLRDHELKVAKASSSFPSAQVKHASKPTQSGSIMHYIADNIHHITLKEAAEHFSYQSNYFSRLCQELFGLPFKELKTHIRLEIAKEQLRLTTKSIDQISRELGYKAVSNFHRNFKAQVGMTPKEYRQESLLVDLMTDEKP